MATLDNHVVALDARTAHVRWNHDGLPASGRRIRDDARRRSPSTARSSSAKAAANSASAASSSRSTLPRATSAGADTRFPGPGEPNFGTYPGNTYVHGGGGAWITGTYDAETRRCYWGVGNPSPWLATQRKGRNLYSDSVIALDVDTGRVKWYFQQTPNDTWDYDATNTPVLADVTIDGRKPRKIFYQAARNGWFYVVDRTNGTLISMTPFTKTTSVTGYDRANADRHHRRRAAAAREHKTVFTCPAFFGGDNWWPYSFDPQTGYAYVPTMHTCMTDRRRRRRSTFQAGAQYVDESSTVEHVPGSKDWGELQAIDVATGRHVWGMQHARSRGTTERSRPTAASCSAARPTEILRVRCEIGREYCGMHHMSSGVIGVPVTYRVDGKQYVAVQSGWGGVAPFYGGKNMTPLFRGIPLGGRLYVFALPGRAAPSQ